MELYKIDKSATQYETVKRSLFVIMEENSKIIEELESILQEGVETNADKRKD